MSEASSPDPLHRSHEMPRRALAYLAPGLFVLMALGLQVQNGAWQSDFGGHADEAAHVVTGLMVRDYLAGPLWQGTPPMTFAREYYEHFPKVALGHYPPGFYALEGLWLLPSRSRTAILLLPVFLAAALAWVTWHVARQLLDPLAAFTVPLTLLGLGLVQTYTAIVMSDLLLALLCLLATLAWGRFVATGTARWSLAFGLLATAAILTKGSGLLLALVPPLHLLLARRLDLLKNWRLWLAPVPVLLFAAPWMLATAKITEEGMSHQPWLAYLTDAIPYYLRALPATFGWALTLAGLLALLLPIGFAVRHGFVQRYSEARPFTPTEEQEQTTPLLALLTSLALATLLFYCFVPSGLDPRYLLPLAPAALILAFTAWRDLTRAWLHRAPYTPVLSTIVFLLLPALTLAETARVPPKMFTGASEAIDAIVEHAAHDRDPRLRILLASDASGEGAFIAAGLLAAPNDLHFLRGSKVLATSDWLGRGYELTHSTTESLAAYLNTAGIDYILLDRGLPSQNIPSHLNQLTKFLGPDFAPDASSAPSAATRFLELQTLPSRRKSIDQGRIQIYGSSRHHDAQLKLP